MEENEDNDTIQALLSFVVIVAFFLLLMHAHKALTLVGVALVVYTFGVIFYNEVIKGGR